MSVAVRAMIGGAEYALAPLTDSLGFLTRVLQVQINERIRENGGISVSLAALSLLRLVQANPGIRQVHAARILSIQESNMVNLVKQLTEEGLVDRRKEERAAAGLWITRKGERAVTDCAWTASVDRSLASALSEAEYRQLVQLLNRVYRASLL